MSRRLQGLPASPGIALGPAWWFRRALPVAMRMQGEDAAVERMRLQEAQERAAAELAALREAQRERLSPEELAIFEAQELMLQDPELMAAVEAELAAGASAEVAWQKAVEAFAAQLSALPDPYFQARAADVRDVGNRVLRHLAGGPEAPRMPDHPVVVVADDLLPSETVTLDPQRVLAFVTEGGGPTAHAAILARRLGVPAVVAVGAALRTVPDGAPLLVDGEGGWIEVEPEPETVRQAQARRMLWLQERAQAEAVAHEPAQTRDGVRIEVAANVGSLEDARQAFQKGADSIGLLRTEFLYLDRAAAPTEEEEINVYRALLEAMGGKPVVVRTLDVGGDKPLPYLPMPPEANPFLGVRGVRLSRQHPDLLRQQLRALLRAGAGFPLRIMFPMVSTVEEIRWLRAFFEEVRSNLAAEGHPLPSDLQVGMMVEVPAAALLAEHFLPWVDFFSLGTNDLTQYTLAADRTNPAVAGLADGLHPAVLRLIRHVTAAAEGTGKWVGVCGELAGDLVAVPVLIGLGVQELSVNPVRVPEVKAAVRRWSMAEARALAEEALRQADPEAVRRRVMEAHP
ncbi:phosphoenolpyruvate--protein phosphotransferase [Thermoflexus sp.]|uniref:phosphoenolpyruvate--protein phosphotransferase n=1 Tax=Thermoflexus sp. TaxID=1969742 RepID=UPI0025EEE7D4|nr:phosphoenolpyruvate--protein phosphotransferase [Thermoflexus sp.]MDW8180678.1 phosphoenolpyruvate--protein phosphotransferase [Anaerolineae bacterium]MCS6964595.1 phosphoenolpyruvate--protein phosphotransferase [Thermoflexus sp.]MCS7351224.1 phosphoenolpyruvate--protein phosphotransferase [Thermoflexus sp.]MCX7690969.1 phosphoenolpyruvate--protein phosphotransferase [Thermoflexus sp.]MDW8184115.1 phosphoenolpyruvate--protein phosphotransferase [Anaerolineae bacterium]